jgi:hypothetical protein
VLWNQNAQTDITIPNNKPGAVIRDELCVSKKNVPISGYRKVIKKEAEKMEI